MACCFIIGAWLMPQPGMAGLAISKISEEFRAGGGKPSALSPSPDGSYFFTVNYEYARSQGALYEFDPVSGSIYEVGRLNDIYVPFRPNVDGMISDGNGDTLKYYGTTFYDGAYGNGSIFEFDYDTFDLSIKASFTGSNGNGPNSRLTSAGNGKYYGTTVIGGANNLGAIFEFDPNSTESITLKASFATSTGELPFASLTAAGNGKYYGTTYRGSAYDNGGVFEFDSATGSITLKDSFNGVNGARPTAALTSAGNGKYYGTTYQGGANGFGGVFEFDSATGFIALKDSFDGPNGAGNDSSALIAAGNGKYYGTTNLGAVNDFARVVYEFNAATGKIRIQDSFDSPSFYTSAFIAAGDGTYLATAQFKTYLNEDQYRYESFVIQFNPAPAPLPVLGIGVAFGWSRRLRLRVGQTSATLA
jgi:uncharacterized repeat protein (TIGR03803 family)